MSSSLDEKEECQQDLSSPTKFTIDDHDIDPVAEKRLLRKLDWALLPLFALLYLTNFIDRTAIGNAKVAGLEKDLGLKGLDYNVALTFFYVAYIIVEIPSNLVLKQFGSIWIAVLVIAFGVVSMSSAFVHNFAGLIATRVFLGFAEGGLLPGVVYMLSRYYRRKEFVFRVGIFFALSPPLAGASMFKVYVSEVGGLLASGLLSINSIGPVTSWRKIFFVEGLITAGIGVVCLFIIPADPERSRLLTKEERVLALKRIALDRVVKNSKREKTRLNLVLRAFNFNAGLNALCYILINISFQGLSLFMPTVIATLGNFSTIETQLRTVPPYLVSGVWAIANSYMSFRTERRGLWIFISVLLSVIGYAIFVATENSQARYAACFLGIAGGTPSGPMMLTWATDNAAPETVRAVTTALVPGLGTIGAIIAVWTYLPNDAPNYHRGNSLNLAACSLVCVLAVIGVRYIHWENAKRDRGDRDRRLVGKSQEEIEELGSRHPAYRYQQ
ncbi:major facilitator superfamily domain-containing protein [Gautieria morchelliformis]|nr:major facilitator superfamily domain-containing protein [Gautieria morchelliformis]